MTHGFNSNSAHYVPFSGEISAMKIQGEGRNYPDAGLIFTPGQCGYDESQSTNPTTMTCPVEMSMQENRYRRMLTPDGTHIQSYVSVLVQLENITRHIRHLLEINFTQQVR